MSSAPRSLGRIWRPLFDVDSGQHSCGLPGAAQLTCTADHTRVQFSSPQLSLNSAVLNGGLASASDFLNMRVDSKGQVSESPQASLARFASSIGCKPDTVGMMTAASMKSLRVCCDESALQALAVVVTTGLENARRAGDPADYHDHAEPPPAGTINLAIVADFALPVATMAEIITVATEAKAAVLQELAIFSPVSGGLATGTGTDAIAVFAPSEGTDVIYAGKHTALGERVASLVMTALGHSIGNWSPRQTVKQGENVNA